LSIGCNLARIATKGKQAMNSLEKVKSDARVVEIRKSIESGKFSARITAKVASGFGKKSPVGPIIPE